MLLSSNTRIIIRELHGIYCLAFYWGGSCHFFVNFFLLLSLQPAFVRQISSKLNYPNILKESVKKQKGAKKVDKVSSSEHI